jgi:hypothetical protein
VAIAEPRCPSDAPYAENLPRGPFPRPVVRDPLRSTDVTGDGGSGMGTAVSEDQDEPDGNHAPPGPTGRFPR